MEEEVNKLTVTLKGIDKILSDRVRHIFRHEFGPRLELVPNLDRDVLEFASKRFDEFSKGRRNIKIVLHHEAGGGSPLDVTSGACD